MVLFLDYLEATLGVINITANLEISTYILPKRKDHVF